MEKMDRNIRTRIPESLVTTGDRTNENPIGLDILHIMIQNKFCTRFQFQFCFFVHTASLRRNRLTISRENFTKQLIRTMATNDTPNLTPNSSQFVKEEEVARGKWLSLNNVTYKDPTGRERLWECVKRTTRQAGSADAVGIIAILKRMLKFDCLVLVVQYRPPMKTCTVEFPAGLVDAGETPETAALRELYEETGFTATVRHVTPALCFDPGVGNTTVQLVSVEIDGNDEKNQSPMQKTDESEFIEVVPVPLDVLLQRLDEYSEMGYSVDSRVYSYALGLQPKTS
ncbi:ADP-sugar pyrophosphatase-like [Ostrea edulis]|uniref:ADP-sugar pyrophosphatase-like n=1 Tax=Ostrea edulis TaxID=37623 RepID=UPI0024AE8C32|nr:ADP-sugar pyrophosphatase-like [Ostrea edulis]